MFFITCMEKISIDDLGWIDYGDKRTFGFYADYCKVKKALNTNRCDMNETIYNYAIVEEIDQGIHPTVIWTKWFKWDREKQGFFEIEEPEETKLYTNYALG